MSPEKMGLFSFCFHVKYFQVVPEFPIFFQNPAIVFWKIFLMTNLPKWKSFFQYLIFHNEAMPRCFEDSQYGKEENKSKQEMMIFYLLFNLYLTHYSKCVRLMRI